MSRGLMSWQQPLLHSCWPMLAEDPRHSRSPGGDADTGRGRLTQLRCWNPGTDALAQISAPAKYRWRQKIPCMLSLKAERPAKLTVLKIPVIPQELQ